MIIKTCQDGTDYLNQHALALQGTELSFKIHYWGGMPKHYDNPIHKHSFYEACYVLDGRGTYMDNYSEFALKPDTLFISRPGIMHQIRSTDGLFILFVAYEVAGDGTSEQAAKHYIKLSNTRKVFLEDIGEHPSSLLWRSLMEQSANPAAYDRSAIANTAHLLLASFPPAFSEQHDNGEGNISHANTSTLLHQARLFIRDNLSGPLSLGDVAGYLHISGRHLSRLFSQEMNSTFTDYLRDEKIRMAIHKLNTTNMPLKLIAEQAGFSSVHYFTKIFKHVVGLTPGKYRENLPHNSITDVRIVNDLRS